MKLSSLLILAVLGLAFSTGGYTQEDMKEMFSCNFHEGKDMDDLMSVRDFYVKQSKKAGLEIPFAFVWTPIKGDFDYDFIWFNYHADLTAFAQFTDAFDAVPALAAVKTRFDSVADCSSDIVRRWKFYDGGEAPVVTPPAFIASSACILNPGVRMQDLGDLWGHISRTLEGFGRHKAFHHYVVSPFTSGPGSPDLFIYGVHDSVTAWAERDEALRNSETGQGLERLVNAVMSCRTSLWNAHWVVKSPFEDR
jgi:hypothetical protein